jgi:hypothetical protein
LQPALRERKQTNRKTVKRQRPRVFSIFAPYQSKSLQTHSLSFHKKHICLTGYIGGQKSTSSGVPIYASAGVLPLAMQALLITLIELLQAFSWWKRTMPTWVAGQTGKSK